MFSSVREPVPSDGREESARLEVGRSLAFLADPSLGPKHAEGLHRLCEMARTLLGMERAYIGVMMEDQQLLVGRANVDQTSAPRQHSLCALTVGPSELVVVEDARLDDRLASNPYVQATPGVRFYARVPLSFGGQTVVSFCVTDSKPRVLSAQQQESLKMLAGLALDQVHVLFELDELRQQASLLVQAEAAVSGGAWEMDLENELAVWSNELYALHEADPTEVVTFEVLPHYYPNGEAERLTDAVTRAVSTGAGFDLQLDYVTKRGQRRCARVTAQVQPREGRSPRIVGSFQDVTPQKVAEAKWRKASLYDAVTGLPNQSRFYARLEASCASGQPGALVVIGLDHFKAINEGRGRAFGDSVLRAIGEKLVADLHHGAFVARLGGDEFGVLLADVQTSEALTAQVQTVRAAVDATLSAYSSRVVAGASLGVVVYPDNASTAQDVMVASDVALRNAKASGGRCTAYFEPALLERLEQKVKLLDDVRRGIGAGEFLLHYQPICNVEGHARGFEALMRWQHPVKGLVAPYHFMAAFEDADLSTDLGDIALGSGIRQVHDWLAAGVECGYLAVNLSSAQLAQPGLVAQVERLLLENGVPARRLMLEVTESVYLDGNRAHIVKTLADLRSLGVTFALDDFGTGYASLSHLKEFPIDRIKVDQSFVREIGKNPGDEAIAGAIVSLGRALRLQVVAEGVETAAQLEFLQGLGCELIQGYYFAKPMPPLEAQKFCLKDVVTD